ncbi:hypothetical protein E1A91_D03G185500v1 [Gossypium mustelinum]|uniref:Uncharacterized protein n=1 Tax=Gossypium mustelinum TaxID=34275 RepID=A0A5D2VPC6_GOSMU|nr:hypothetical protein E1A91_D03G185500v1 [Gossypium mustelinum]
MIKRLPRPHNKSLLCNHCTSFKEYMGNFIELESDKDKRSRKRIKDCNELVGELMRMLLDGDDRYRAARKWEEKKEIVVEGMNRLRDPQLLLQRLRNLMQPRIVDNASSSLSIENAFQELDSFLNQSTNPVRNIECADEICKDLPHLISLIVKAFQGEAIVDQTEELISEAKVFSIVAKIVNKVLASFLVMLQDIKNQKLTNPVSIQDLVQMEDEHLIFHFPLTPDCTRGAKIHINLQGYHEVDSLEKGLNVDPVPDLLSLPFFDVEDFLLSDDKIYNDLTEGGGDVRANQDDMKLSTVQGHADVQRIIMNSLAEVYHKIESNPEILELKVITTMEAMVQDIMNKLMKAREMEYQAEEKRFEKKKANVRKDKLKLEKDEADLKEKKLKLDQDEADLKEKKLKLDQDEAELKENQLKLARLQKKPRVE